MDSTYKANQHDFPLVVFTTFDRRRRVLLIGQCVTISETTLDFKWILTSFVELNDGVMPRVIFTDRATAILRSVREVFRTNTVHFTCLYHIKGNVKQQALKANLDADAVQADFVKMIFAPTEEVFLSRLGKLQGKYPALHGYLADLRPVRRLFAQFARMDIFCLAANSTQSVESMHHAIKNNADLNMRNVAGILKHLDKFSKEAVTIKAMADCEVEAGVALTTRQYGKFEPVFTLVRELFSPFVLEFIVGELSKLYNLDFQHLSFANVVEYIQRCKETIEEEQVVPHRFDAALTEDDSSNLWFIVTPRDSDDSDFTNFIVCFNTRSGKLLCECDTPIHGGLVCSHFLVLLLGQNEVFFHRFLIHAHYCVQPNTELIKLVRLARGQQDQLTQDYCTAYLAAANEQWNHVFDADILIPVTPVTSASEASGKRRELSKKLKRIHPQQLELVDAFLDELIEAARPEVISSTSTMITDELVIAKRSSSKESDHASSTATVFKRQSKPYKAAQQACGNLPVQLKQQAAKRKASALEESDADRHLGGTTTTEFNTQPGSPQPITQFTLVQGSIIHAENLVQEPADTDPIPIAIARPRRPVIRLNL